MEQVHAVHRHITHTILPVLPSTTVPKAHLDDHHGEDSNHYHHNNQTHIHNKNNSSNHDAFRAQHLIPNTHPSPFTVLHSMDFHTSMHIAMNLDDEEAASLGGLPDSVCTPPSDDMASWNSTDMHEIHEIHDIHEVQHRNESHRHVCCTCTHHHERERKGTNSNVNTISNNKSNAKAPLLPTTPRQLPSSSSSTNDVIDKLSSSPLLQVSFISSLHPPHSPPSSSSPTSSRTKWKVRASKSSMRTTNPIRAVVDKIDYTLANPNKQVLSLSLGDPTVHGNLKTHHIATQALIDSISSMAANGYPPMVGLDKTRDAVAKAHSIPSSFLHFDSKDVIMSNGCSHALQMCFNALADQGGSILIPSPGFSLYKSLCDNLGIEAREYKLLPDQNWEIDLDDVVAKVDASTVAIVFNSPSNPTGSVYSEKHVSDFLNVCAEQRLVVVADEIYYNFVFPSQKISWKSVCQVNTVGPKSVPILCLGGLSKRFLVPGWCLGWILIHDPDRVMDEMRIALEKLASLIVGPSAPVQHALPRILSEVPESWHISIATQLEKQATFCYDKIKALNPKALEATMPSGSIFMLVKINTEFFEDIADDIQFASKLFQEQSVIVLPGECFSAPGYIRITYSAPIEILEQAMDRIVEFCQLHIKLGSI